MPAFHLYIKGSTVYKISSVISDITKSAKKASKLSVVTAIVIGIPPLLLVAGSVLSLQNG